MVMGIWKILGDVIQTRETLVPRENLLFVRCPQCTEMVVWRPFKTKIAFSASCCSYALLARPTTIGTHTFRVSCRDADMTNVAVLSAAG